MDKEIEQMLNTMTLPEKVGQLLLVYFNGPALSSALQEMIHTCHIGGVILYQSSGNLENISQVRTLTQGIQNSARIPLWIAIDQEGGTVDRLPTEATHFPSAMAIAATHNLHWAEQMATITAAELRAMGVNLNFAPVVDVNSNPVNPIIGIRAYGSDPQQVSQWAQVVMQTYGQAGLLTTLKHFPGHGNTTVDSHRGLPRVECSHSHLQQVDLLPFQHLIQAGAPAIMTAHVLVPALDPDWPATLSPRILQDLLRQKWGFQGLVVTDSLTMGALDQTWKSHEAAVLAFQAGADILLFGADADHSPKESQIAFQHLLKAVETGVISEERLDQSVGRILKQKGRTGLWDAQPALPLEEVGCAAHQQVSQQIAQASMTLVQDEQDILPLTPDEKILVIWPQSRGDLGTACLSLFPDTICMPLSWHPQEEEIAQVQQQAQQRSIIVVGTYEVYRYPAQIQLIKSLLLYRLVVIAMGSPYDLLQFPEIPCYVVTYGDGTASLMAAIQMIAGQFLPQGHLPVDLSLSSLGC